MRRLLLNRRVWIAVIVVGGLAALALWPSTVPVDTAVLARGPLMVTVDEEGRTRVRDRYVVSAPVSGRVLRIDLEPGDHVHQGDVVARMRAEAPALLDARTHAQAQAAVDAADATLGQTRAEEQRAKAQLAQLERDLARAQDLAKAQLVAPQELDAREAAVRTARESANAASFAVRAAESDLQRARAQLNPAPRESGRVVDVRSPIDGVVLKRERESESVVPAGDPLVDIGDPSKLEIVADLLSTDAVKVMPGARAIIDQWGGQRTLDARVRRVEPSGFTKVSALGVEEQRVNVLLDFTDPAQAWAALGDAYRVEVHVVTWESRNVLRVPTSALFRVGNDWAVYVVEGGRARRTMVMIGHQTGQEAEVTSGVAAGARVVLHPGDSITDGTRVSEASPAAGATP
jgi:HlyD family secretion protein